MAKRKIRIPEEFKPLQGNVVLLRNKITVETESGLVLPEGLEGAIEDAKAEEAMIKEPQYNIVLQVDGEIPYLEPGDMVMVMPGAMSVRFSLNGEYVSMMGYHYLGAVKKGKIITEGSVKYIEVEQDDLYVPVKGASMPTKSILELNNNKNTDIN